MNVKLSSFYVVYLLLGSELVGLIPSLLRINPQVFLWFAAAINLSIALYIILKGVARGTSVFNFDKLFAVFLIIFFFQMVVDLYINRIYTSTFSNPITYFIYGIGICFVPSYALKYTNLIDFDWVLRWFYRLLLLFLLLTVVYNSFLGIASSSEMRNRGSDTLGALTYGHMGVSFSLISLHFLVSKKGVWNKFLYSFSFFFGLFVMYLASSRSPLVALFICSVLYLLINRGLSRGLIFLALLVMPIYLFWDQILGFLSNFHGQFIYRVVRAIEAGDISGRDIIYQEAIKQFNEAPIFGNSFLIREGIFAGFYPHNLILESLIATGIVGTICFCIWLFRTFRYVIKIFNLSSPNSWIGILFVQYFIFGMVSKSLYTNGYLWYFAFLVWNVYYTSRKERQNYHRSNLNI